MVRENKLRILVADDELGERDTIMNWIKSVLPPNTYILIDFADWDAAVKEIGKKKQDLAYDFVLTDIYFENQQDGRSGGKKIIEAATKHARKTRVIVVSGNFDKNDVLAIYRQFPSIITISKTDPTQDYFNSLFYPELERWCEYKFLQMSLEQRKNLTSALADKKNNAKGDLEFKIGNEKWKLKYLVPHINWEDNNETRNFQKVISFIIKYPLVESKAWYEPNSNGYTLAIKDYYEELYYNPNYSTLIEKIKADSIGFLTFSFKYFVYNVLSDITNKSNTGNALRRDYPNLFGTYTQKLEGENMSKEIERNTMISFGRNLTGRLIAHGLYLFLDYSILQTFDLLQNQSFNIISEADRVQPDKLFSQYFFIKGASSIDTNQEPTKSHKKYNTYGKIYNACSEDEKAILNEWWKNMQAWLANESNLCDDNKKTVSDRINQYLHYILPT